MKKKGLIISTVVMVVVLIASLTTATFAWFTADNQTIIHPIQFSVAAGSDVSIGLKTDNTYAEGATDPSFVCMTTSLTDTFYDDTQTTNDAKFKNVVVKTGDSYWQGTEGLGSSIDMQLDLQGMKKAVGSGMINKSAGAMSLSTLRTLATSTTSGTVRASGVNSVATANSVEVALAQRDYLDVVIGVRAAASNLKDLLCNITVNPTAGNRTLGMNAAIHYAYKVNGTLVAGADNSDTNLYPTSDTYSKRTADLALSGVDGNTNTLKYGGSAEQTLNPGAKNIQIKIAQPETDQTYINQETIYQVHILIWIDGSDPDCRDEGKGVGSTIYINFCGTKDTTSV